MSSRHLITTADERTWKFDTSVVFLGEWCKRYDRRAIWSSLDAEVMKPFGLGEGDSDRYHSELETLSNTLLDELVSVLNNYHGTNYSQRYWNIVVGHWLQRFTKIVFNRYSLIEKALSEYEVSGTTLYDINSYSLATKDSVAFTPAYNSDIWNNILFGKIFRFMNVNIDVEYLPDALNESRYFEHKYRIQSNTRLKIKKTMLSMFRFITPRSAGENDAFIVNSYLPKIEELKLQLSFGQIPRFWESPVLNYEPPNQEKRRELTNSVKTGTGFEGFIRSILFESLPACFVENYNLICEEIDSLPWPKNPKFIFTSNNYISDEVFKIWTAGNTEKNVPYFIGQHGNYHANKTSFSWPEVVTSDRFFTWGWGEGVKNFVPSFVFNIVGRKANYDPDNGGLLLIETTHSYWRGPTDLYYGHINYQEDQFRFVEGLPDIVQQKLTVRFHG